MGSEESNIIAFKKQEQSKKRKETQSKETDIYDSIFTPELHKQLLEKARKENACD
ncbi:hypothetical protein HLH17_09360 [Acinetobacter sp. ANC 5380]|uniref:Uncharacterized protein n=1 Tax=Acinetobacter terrae TaxID=2731247 RepID=A0A7Y2RFI9_9GAMM|nr:hypothetical protein [Acinetobacter terrae]NNH77863.1 hypothetical protein [Acinetobacter terrae]